MFWDKVKIAILEQGGIGILGQGGIFWNDQFQVKMTFSGMTKMTLDKMTFPGMKRHFPSTDSNSHTPIFLDYSLIVISV